MYSDGYNVAYKYLKNKYGCKRVSKTNSFENKLRQCSSNKERDVLIAQATDNDYNISLNPITESNDIVIDLLMKQYHYGIAAKKELCLILQSRGLFVSN